MNTYIWNTNYTTYVTMAEDVESARKQIIRSNPNRSSSYVPHVDWEGIIPKRRCHIYEDFEDFISLEEPLVVRANESVIYDHTNE